VVPLVSVCERPGAGIGAGAPAPVASAGGGGGAGAEAGTLGGTHGNPICALLPWRLDYSTC